MPFAETALFGDDNGEAILHFGAVRLRVNGTGNLDLTFYGLDKVLSQLLYPLAMATAPGRELRVLSNFKSQRAMLRFETDLIDEVVTVNRVVLFVKELWQEYPG